VRVDGFAARPSYELGDPHLNPAGWDKTRGLN
jgi:hypothetical protein